MATGIHSVSAETGYEITPVTSGIEMKWNATNGEFYAINRPAGTYAAITARGLWTFTDAVTFTDLVLSGDLAVNGGDITSSAATFNLLNSGVTTMNFAGAATTMTVGATSGTMTLRNSTIAITNDLTVGDDITITGDFTQSGTGTTLFRNTGGGKTITIQGDTSVNTLSLIGYRAASDPIGGNIRCDGARGTQASPLIMTQNSMITQILSRGWDGTSAFLNACAIYMYCGTGTPSTTSMPGRLSFLTTPDGSTTLTEALRIDQNQDLIIFNQLLGNTDNDSYLNLNGASGDVELASADDMIFRIDSDNNTTGKTFKWQHNASTDLMELQDDGDLILSVGDFYINDRIIYTSHANTFLDFSDSVLLAAKANVTIDMDNDASGIGSFIVTKSNEGTQLFTVLSTGDVNVLAGDLYVYDKIYGIAINNFLDLCYDSNTSSILMQAFHDMILDIDADSAGGGDFKVTKNNIGTALFTVENDGDTIVNAGNFSVNTAGKSVRIKEGSNACMGQAVLVAGTVTVSTTAVTANSRIHLTRAVTGGTVGHLRINSISAGTNFVITSSSGTETSTINWIMFEPA